MLEGYEISYQPLNQADLRFEAHQDEFWMEAAGRTGWPGAIDEHYLQQTDSRAHFVIVQGTKVRRILSTPLEKDFPGRVWEDAMVEVMHEMGKLYPSPEYDMAFGGSCLADAMRAFPLAVNSDKIPIEKIVLTSKATLGI